jgi:hypothetical protein
MSHVRPLPCDGSIIEYVEPDSVVSTVTVPE